MEQKPNEKYHFLALAYIILVALSGIFSLASFSSVDNSLNSLFGMGKNDYLSAMENAERMIKLVHEQDLLICHYLMNPADFPPSESFYSQTKAFNVISNTEYEYADSLEDINYTYHIKTRHNAFVDMFSQLLNYTKAMPAETEKAYLYYKDEISPQVASIHKALQAYRDHKRQKMEWEKEMTFTSVKTAFAILFFFFATSGLVCFYLFRNLLRTNLTPVYSVLEEQQKLEKMKSDFVSTISHEFKTPLTSIVMGIDLLHNENVGLLNEEQEDIVDALTEDSLRLIGLANNLLELSKIESANTVYAFEQKNLEDIINSSMVPFLSIAKKSDIFITFEPVLPLPKVVVDESKITWVMNNLLSNALKYTSEGDSIIIKSHYDPDGFIVVSVKDTGVGIPIEYTENIFERYFQVQDSDIELGGTGLGLAVAKDIITAHGGSIWCTSQLGEGSTFTFTIPQR